VRGVALVVFGFALLVFGSAVTTVVPLGAYVPNLVLPIALFLGVSADVHIVRGAVSCFMLGYLLDSFSGGPMGLQTFTLVASFLVARGAGLRALPQGSAVQIALTAALGVLSGGLVLALRAIFERAFALDLAQAWATLFPSVLATTLCAPFVFAALRRVASPGGMRGEERAAS
jgi:rod shape-determining protein MreD